MADSTGTASGAEQQHFLRGAEGALRAGDRAKALAIADEACRQGVEHFHLFMLAAQHNLARGDAERALGLALRARELNPRNVDVLNTLGVVHVGARRYREALKAFDAALRNVPTAYFVRVNKASALEELQELDRARVEFERVIDGEPRHVEALARLALLAVQRGDIAEARTYAERALGIDPGHQTAKIALAMADIEENRFDAALALARPVAAETNLAAPRRAIAQGLVGDALDGLGRTAEAFAAYAGSKATLRAHHRPFYEKPENESSRKLVARLAAYFHDAPVSRWRRDATDDAAPPARTHVFVVGFPRSGTTMLEQILATHPEVEAMGERSCLVSAQESFSVPLDGLEKLARLGGSDLAPWRDDYWKCVGEEGFAAKKPVFVDKMPFYCVFLCLIAKLFPRARIVFAVRDPRDVILSCLRRRFVMTSQLYELTSLETAAAYYDATMHLCEEYRRVLGLDICDVRHEDLVADFDGETRRICAFLGLEWVPALKDFSRLARAVATPSGPQLARGLLTQGAGQWRRYRAQLAPVLPVLARWVARFGYAED